MISCADILIEDTSNTTSTSGIVGFWFNCEFNSSDTDCRFFDDDGYQFTDDGSFYSVEAILFEPDPGCGSYTCFDSFKPSIFKRELKQLFRFCSLLLLKLLNWLRKTL